MSAGPCFLGIDLGTSAAKAVLVATDGAVVATGVASYPILRPQPDRAEQDPDAWLRATRDAVHRALAQSVAEPRVVAIGLSGQMHGTVLLDSEGEVLASAIIWPDRRSVRQVQEITELVGAQRLIERAGSPVATGFQAATLRWIQQEEPDLWRKVRTVFLPKDYLRWHMTGKPATDPSDGSGSLLLDVRERSWSSHLLSALGISPEVLPPVRPSIAQAGPLTAGAARKLALQPGTPVVVGGADTACSLLGAGVFESGRLLLTISTGGQLAAPAALLRVDRQGRTHTFCSALEPMEEQAAWYQMGAILSAGMALRWLRDNVFDLAGADAYEQMATWASSAPPGADGLLFLPYLAGERTPHMSPWARGLFSGLTLAHGRAEMVRAVMEGVAFACRDALDVLSELGVRPHEVILAGGGARSPLWRQIVADVFGLTVLPLVTADQSAVGAAMLAGAGSGHVDLRRSAGSWPRYGSPVTPLEEPRALYQELFARFQDAYRRNRTFWEEGEEAP
jgi:xylulokinase